MLASAVGIGGGRRGAENIREVPRASPSENRRAGGGLARASPSLTWQRRKRLREGGGITVAVQQAEDKVRI